MEVEYKREMNRNYMVVRPEPGHVDRYTVRMLAGNQIGGCLPFREKWMDGENRYYYDITSKQPLGRLLEYRRMSGEELYSFWTGFLNAMRQMERFLLDENQVCLDPEYIYVEPGSFQCALLIIPGKYLEYTDGFRSLCQYLLDHVNQNDGDAVILGFSVFKESQKPNFGLDDIEQCLERKKKQEHILGEKAVPEIDTRSEQVVRSEEPIWERSCEMTREEIAAEQRSEIPTQQYRRWGTTAVCVIALMIPVILFLMGGVESLFRFRWYILGTEILMAGGVLLLKDFKEAQLPYEHPLGREEPPIMDDDYFETKEDLWKMEPKEEAEDESPHTVLLTAKPVGGTCRFLVPVGGGEEVIIRYFPFLIGKNRSIVDFYLNEDGISRMHAKLEECDGQYYVTDLNSTNGIMVDGVWLETNERRLLPIGSELVLAASRFYFR